MDKLLSKTGVCMNQLVRMIIKPSVFVWFSNSHNNIGCFFCDHAINPEMDMQKIVALDCFGVRADPREHFVKNVTLSKSQL